MQYSPSNAWDRTEKSFIKRFFAFLSSRILDEDGMIRERYAGVAVFVLCFIALFADAIAQIISNSILKIWR